MYKIITKYTLSAILLVLSMHAQATIYTIGGSSQTFDELGTIQSPPGSNFTMFIPVSSGVGKVLANPDSLYPVDGGTQDVTGTFNDALLCFDVSCTNYAMSFSSATRFSGSFWSAHDIRVFGPGTYQFDTCLADGSTTCTPGDPNTIIKLVVGPGRVGAQVYFDWSGNANIDVFLLWQPNAIFTRPAQFGGLLVADSRTYQLASRDVDGDGNPGSAMTDGPFGGHNASFSLFLGQPVAIPALPTMAITQPGNSGASAGTIDSAGATVTIATGILAAANLSFDWDVTVSPKYADNSDMYPASAASLVTANINGTTSTTFDFDPTNVALIPGSTLRASVRVTNTDNGLSNGATVTMLMGCPAGSALIGLDTDGDGIDDNVELCGDDDGDGILNFLDPAGFAAYQVSVDLPARTVATSGAGVLSVGELARFVRDSNNQVGSGISVSLADIGTTDDAVVLSCVGGCFDFIVTGGALAGAGTSASVVIPLTTPVPERAVYRKFINGAWSGFNATANLDGVNSAASIASVCPAPGDSAYSNGLVAGDDCLQISIEDNGPNDSDAANGKIADPGGIGQLAAVIASTTPKTKVDGGVFGCSASATPIKVTDSGELYLLLGFVIWLGLYRTRVVKENI